MTYSHKNHGLEDDLGSFKAISMDLDLGNDRGLQTFDTVDFKNTAFVTKSNVSEATKSSTGPHMAEDIGVWSLAVVNNLPVVFSFLTTWMKTLGIDFNAPTKNNIYGYLFERNTFACFKLEFNLLQQQNTETKILQLRRLQGDAFLMETFFQRLKTDLEKAGHCEAEEMEEDFDDLDELFQSDSGIELPNYLNLSFDPEIVNMWCMELAGQHFENIVQILLLLAYNAENAANLEIFLRQKQQIVDALFGLLKCKENCTSLPVARSIAKVLCQLCSHHKITLTWEQVELLGSLLIGWSEEGNFNMHFPVTYSEQICSKVAETLSQICVDGAPKATSPVFQELQNLTAKRSLNETVNSHLKTFVQSITVC